MLIRLTIGIVLLLAASIPAACSAPPTTCTVGYAGTDLNITVHGVSANDACAQLEKKGSTSTGGSSNLPPGAGYATDPKGTLMCRYTVKGMTYTVRDQGLLKLYGNAYCVALSSEAS